MAMIQDTYYFNGIKAVNINNLPEEAWQVVAGEGAEDDSQTVMNAYKYVPFFRRCVDLRASAVSRMPRDIMRGGEAINENDIPALADLNKLLFQIESALVLYAYAYLYKFQNRLQNDIGLRWLAPRSVSPIYDTTNDGRLTGFRRKLKNSTLDIPADEIVYFWTPTIDTEVGPGHSVGLAALRGANVLEGTTLFSKSFFERGAVYPMLLSVDGSPSREEMDKLEAWWKRLTRGVKDAWNTVAVRASVTPKIIGPPIKDMEMRGLTETQRENIATALGVPHSLVLSNAANYATAQQDTFNFYDFTIVPQCDLIAETINNQYLNDLGLELVFQPKRLEAYQWRNLQSSDSVVSLSQAGVIDRNEAREVVGYEPAEGNDASDEPIIMQLPVSTDEPQADEMRQTDLEKWQRKALSSLKSTEIACAPFESDHISYTETNAILNELALCHSQAEVKAVFSERFN